LIRIDEHLQAGGGVTLTVEGRLEIGAVDVLERECLRRQADGAGLSLDLSAIRSVDAAGLAGLRRLQLHQVRLIACPPLILELLEQEGLP